MTPISFEPFCLALGFLMSYFISSMTLSTSSRVSRLTYLVLLMTWDTVVIETPAFWATSSSRTSLFCIVLPGIQGLLRHFWLRMDAYSSGRPSRRQAKRSVRARGMAGAPITVRARADLFGGCTPHENPRSSALAPDVINHRQRDNRPANHLLQI